MDFRWLIWLIIFHLLDIDIYAEVSWSYNLKNANKQNISKESTKGQES